MDLRQQFARRLVYPLALWRSGDQAQHRYLREFERTQFLPPEELRALQLQRLQTLVEHAYRACPFYRKRFDRAGLLPGDVQRLEDVRALPPVTREEVQRHRDLMVARGWPAADRIENQTGGSLGTPISFFVSRDRVRSRNAAARRHNRWAGWDVGVKAALMWGAHRDAPQPGWRGWLRNLLLDRQLFLNTGHLTESVLLGFHEALRRFRPQVIQAYARSAGLFARFLRARGVEPYRPRAIITSAELLTPEDRAVIEEVFDCPVFNRYGTRDVGIIASECDAHAGLHVMAEGLYVEVVRDGRPARPGETGAVLVTDLLNLAMPLIRYRIGDVASWAEGACRCGRGLPRLRDVAGRATDFLVGADGRLVSGPFLAFAVVAKRVSLGQVQMEQTEAGKVLYRIKPGPGFNKLDDIGFLEEMTRRYLGPGATADYELVEEMVPPPSGKFVFCRSTVAPDFLATGRPDGGAGAAPARPERV